MSEDLTAEKKMIKARAGLVLDAPFFGSLALRLKIIETPWHQTAWTDGTYLGYNPDWIDTLSLAQTKGLLCHEVMHLACGHQSRRDSREPGLWNMAGDFAINSIIQEAGFELPDHGCLDDRFKDKAAENIYATLLKEQNNSGKNQPCQDGQGGQTSQPSSPGSNNDSHQTNDPGKCGEVKDAAPENAQAPQENQQAKPQPTSPNELTKSEEDWKIAATQAAQEAKNQGGVEGQLGRFIDALTETKSDWKAELRDFVDHVVKNDYTWLVPNRRYVGMGLMLPSLAAGMELQKAVIGVDASGSVYDEELAQFGAELTAIIEAYPNIELEVRYFDTKVRGDKQEFDAQSLPVVLQTTAGGGTNFKPIFKEINKLPEAPKFAIIFTDMECDSFPDKPDYPVLWGRTGGGGYKPPFGRIIDVEVMDEK